MSSVHWWAVGGCALALLGCQDRPSSPSGWAAQVPANATRFTEQPVNEAPPPAVAKVTEASAKKKAPPQSFSTTITQPTTVTLWHAYRAAERKALEQVVDRFHALGTPIKVKLRAVPFDAFNDKIHVVIPEGRGPDLFIFAHDLTGAWSEMGFLEPLSSWTRPEDTDSFVPQTVRALVYRNALYGLPMAFKCVALFYNKALVPEPPATVAELVKIAAAHTDGQGRYGLVYEASNLYFHAAWLHGFGGQTIDANDVPHLYSDASVQALELARQFVKTHKITPAAVTTAMVSGYFNAGQAAMVINGPWMWGEIEGVDYGVVPIPALEEGKPARPFLSVEALFLNKHSAHKQAAFEVMRYLVGEESARIRLSVGRQPVANAAAWDSPGNKVDPRMRAFLKQAKEAVVMSSSPRMQQVWTPYNSALLSVIAGDSKPAAALKKAHKAVKKAFRRAGQVH